MHAYLNTWIKRWEKCKEAHAHALTHLLLPCLPPPPPSPFTHTHTRTRTRARTRSDALNTIHLRTHHHHHHPFEHIHTPNNTTHSHVPARSLHGTHPLTPLRWLVVDCTKNLAGSWQFMAGGHPGPLGSWAPVFPIPAVTPAL